MSDDFAPSADQSEAVRPITHGRILWLMAAVGVVGAIVGMVFGSFRFGLGVFIGTALAFANYYWLKNSLRKIFKVAETGERPRMLAGTYFLRYLVLAAVVAVIYVADLVPIVALILGLAAFGFAVFIEGLIRIVRP